MALSSAFKALNDSTRRDILDLLHIKDMTAGEIVDRFSISGPSISHHLDLLKQANLIISRKEGQFIIYSLNTSVLDEILSWLIEIKNSKR
jgi:ArsR family transcriptional regulator, arsenate/arsenite/antimonite-responsive transcriptional repressor